MSYITAGQARAMAHLMEVFNSDRQPKEWCPFLEILDSDDPESMTVEMFAALDDEHENETIIVSILDDGAFFIYDWEADITRWVVPAPIPHVACTGARYAGTLVEYDKGGPGDVRHPRARLEKKG